MPMTLFIGGSHDGQRISVENDLVTRPTRSLRLIHRYAAGIVEHYRLMEIATAKQTFFVAHIDLLTPEQVFESLISRYPHTPRAPENLDDVISFRRDGLPAIEPVIIQGSDSSHFAPVLHLATKRSRTTEWTRLCRRGRLLEPDIAANDHPSAINCVDCRSIIIKRLEIAVNNTALRYPKNPGDFAILADVLMAQAEDGDKDALELRRAVLCALAWKLDKPH